MHYFGPSVMPWKGVLNCGILAVQNFKYDLAQMLERHYAHYSVCATIAVRLVRDI